ncbi:MAG: ribonuclease III [Phycisphaeraceae bacterium]|nr:ribonuclease III [Phycisphaeraceae bacterium]MBX3407739.1 ribonuclease III [Phycisphaeraceae bacterium]
MPLEERLEKAQQALGYRFADSSLLGTALTHASLTDSRLHSNERLEFLGDAVLGLICCEEVFTLYPELLEGEMTKIKSLVVSRASCAVMARRMGLDGLIMLGKGMQTHRELPQSLAAGIMEAMVAAVYLDGGLSAARAFLRPLLQPVIRDAYASGHQDNYKSLLQQVAQQQFGDAATYIVLDEKGPDHSKAFELCVEIGGRRFPSTWGASKKQAEQAAALAALIELGVTQRDDAGRIRLVRPAAAADLP